MLQNAQTRDQMMQNILEDQKRLIEFMGKMRINNNKKYKNKKT